MDTEAEDGVCSIGSMDAMNMNTTSQPTQATQAPESSQLVHHSRPWTAH